MKRLVTLLLLVTSVTCFADWREWDDVVDDIILEEDSNINKIKKFRAEGEFGKTNNNKTSGLHLMAILKNWHAVQLRLNHDTVYYRVILGSKLSDKGCNVYLDLLDADKFLIQSFKLSRLAADYEGNITGTFHLPQYKHKEIKYCELSITN